MEQGWGGRGPRQAGAGWWESWGNQGGPSLAWGWWRQCLGSLDFVSFLPLLCLLTLGDHTLQVLAPGLTPSHALPSPAPSLAQLSRGSV